MHNLRARRRAQRHGRRSERHLQRHESVIKVLALGHSKLKVKLELVQPFDSPEGPTANMGSAEGEATIEGDTATFQPPDTRTCTITLTFQGNGTLKVTQDAQDVDCGFGHHVRADGTYKKVKGGKPNFEEE